MAKVFDDNEYKGELHWIRVTPCGAHCSGERCAAKPKQDGSCKYFAVKEWKTHFTKYHLPKKDHSKKKYVDVEKRIEASIERARGDWLDKREWKQYLLFEYSPYGAHSLTHDKTTYYCTECYKVFDFTCGHASQTCTEEDVVKNGIFSRMKCGRLYPLELLGIQRDKTPTEPRRTTSTGGTRNTKYAQSFIDQFTRLPPHCDGRLLDTEEFLTRYKIVETSESVLDMEDCTALLNEYISKLLEDTDGSISHDGKFEQVKERIQNSVLEMENCQCCIEGRTELKRLSDLFVRVNTNVMSISYDVLRDVKAILGTFELDESGESADPQKYSFRIRKNDEKYTTEFHHLLVHLYKSKSQILQKYMEKVGRVNYSEDEEFRNGLIAQLIIELCLEEVNNEEETHTFLEWLFFRSFAYDSSKGLALRPPGARSSQWAIGLYLLRLGALVFAAMGTYSQDGDASPGNVKKNLMKACVHSNVFQKVSFTINVFRRMTKSSTSRGRMDPMLNVTVDNLCISYKVWKDLIPAWKRRAKSLLYDCFVDDKWERFLSGQQLIIRSLLDLDVEAILQNGESIQLKDLGVKENLQEFQVTSLVSCFLILFCGLSGAPDRIPDIQNLKMANIQVNSFSLYFQTRHGKQGNTRNTKHWLMNALGQHKCPPSTVAFFLLYRCIFSSLPQIKNDEEAKKKLFPQFSKSEWSDCSGTGLRNELAFLFCADRRLLSGTDQKQMRQFFATMINYSSGIVPERLSANDTAAQCSSHTAKTHKRNYATTIEYGAGGREEEVFFEFHKLLGEYCDTRFNNDGNLTRKDYIEALNLLGFPGFRNKEQEDLIRLSNIGSSNHLFGLLPCGAGKTLAVYLPIVACLLKNYSPGMRILIVPYKFLVESLLSSIKEKTSELEVGEIRVQGYGADSIRNDRKLPSDLEGSNYPNILILTLDAAANLLMYHHQTIVNWKIRKLLSAVFIDEAQILLTESLFRSKVVESLNRWASVGVQVVCMSGSFPYTAIPSVMKYLGLSSGDCSDIEIIKSDDLVPSGFSFDVVTCDKTDFTRYAVDITIHKLKNIGGSVQIMCQTTNQCTKIQEYLIDAMKSHDVSYVVDVVMKLEENAESSNTKKKAEKWRDGITDVLITTTAGQVGIESTHARHVIIVDVIYNIIYLLQCIGRIRQEQCDGTASVTQLFDDKNTSTYLITQAEENVEYLLSKGMISQSDKTSVDTWVRPEKYHEALNMKCCKFQAINQIIDPTKNGNNRCDQCTWCTRGTPFVDFRTYMEIEKEREEKEQPPKRRRMSPCKQSDTPWLTTCNSSDNNSHIEELARIATQDYDNHLEMKKSIDEFFNMLARTEHNHGCYFCGDMNHHQRDCTMEFRFRRTGERAKALKDWLVNHNVCTSCYGPYEWCEEKCNLDNGSIRKMLFKKKLQTASNMDFDKFIKEHYCSEKKRYLFWNELRKDHKQTTSVNKNPG